MTIKYHIMGTCTLRSEESCKVLRQTSQKFL